MREEARPLAYESAEGFDPDRLLLREERKTMESNDEMVLEQGQEQVDVE